MSQQIKNLDWKTYTIGSLCEISRGGSPRPIQDFLTTSPDGYNWLRIGDVPTKGKFISKITAKITKEGLKKTTLVKPGDFILSNSMSFGRPYIMNVDACIHDGWLALKNLDASLIERDYLFYLLLSPKLQNDFRNYSAGSGVLNLKKDTVEKVLVTLPEVHEQKKIVKVLETWDGAIEKLSQTIASKREVKKGLMQKLLSGKLRLPGFDGEWKSTKLEALAEMFGDGDWIESKDQSDSGFRIIQTGNIGLGIFKDKGDRARYISEETFKELKCTEVFEGDLLISRLPEPAGRSALLPKLKDRMVTAVDCTIVRVNKKIADRDFVYHFTNSENYFTQVQSNLTGSTRQRISRSNLGSINISLPSLEEQEVIAKLLTSFDKDLQIMSRKLRLFKDQKDYLLNNLVTGQIRTPENL